MELMSNSDGGLMCDHMADLQDNLSKIMQRRLKKINIGSPNAQVGSLKEVSEMIRDVVRIKAVTSTSTTSNPPTTTAWTPRATRLPNKIITKADDSFTPHRRPNGLNVSRVEYERGKKNPIKNTIAQLIEDSGDTLTFEITFHIVIRSNPGKSPATEKEIHDAILASLWPKLW